MSDRGLWERLNEAHIVRVLLVYLAVSWVVLQLAATLNDLFALPTWLGPITLGLLIAGLVVVLATAWVQSHPLTDQREAADEVPESWEIDVKGVGEAIAKGEVPHLTWGRAILGGVFAFSLLFGVAGLYVVIQDRGRSFTPEQLIAADADPGIAVLPFSVSGSGMEDMSEGMVELLFTNLDGVPGIRPISPLTVLTRWNERVPDDTEVDLATALEIAAATGAWYAVVGSAVTAGPTLRLAASVYEVSSTEPLGQVDAEGPQDSIWSVVDRLSIEIVAAIGEVTEGETVRINLEDVTTESLDALKAYLRGQALYRGAEFEAAVSEFEQAVAEDSAFALAHLGLGFSLSWDPLVRTPRRAEIPVQLQAALEHPLTQRQELAARAYLAQQPAFMSTDMATELQQAISSYPDDAQLWYLLGEQYLHVGGATGAFDDHGEKAERAFERAVELAPDFAPYWLHMFDLAYVRADSLRIAELLSELGRVSGGSDALRSEQTLFRVAFAGSLDELELQAGLDTLEELGHLWAAYGERFVHPRFWPAMEAVIERIRERYPGWRECGRRQRYLTPGHFQAYLAEALVPPASPWCFYLAYEMDLPLPEQLVDSVIAAGLDSVVAAGAAYYDFGLSVYLADQERWAAFDTVLAFWRANGDAAREEGVAWADVWQHRVSQMEGYREWRSGRLERAVDILEDLPAGYRLGSPELPWWLGSIYMELERPADALRQFRTLQGVYNTVNWTMAYYRAGEAYEKLGEVEKAREQYSYFVDAWKDADPELQPWVQRGREALERLGPLDQ